MGCRSLQRCWIWCYDQSPANLVCKCDIYTYSKGADCDFMPSTLQIMTFFHPWVPLLHSELAQCKNPTVDRGLFPGTQIAVLYICLIYKVAQLKRNDSGWCTAQRFRLHIWEFIHNIILLLCPFSYTFLQSLKIPFSAIYQQVFKNPAFIIIPKQDFHQQKINLCYL